MSYPGAPVRPFLALLCVATFLSLNACNDDSGGSGIGDPDGGPRGIGDCEGMTICGDVCCAQGEECVAGLGCLPLCESGIRCGSQLICCGDGETCMNGNECAPAGDCGQGVRCGSSCCAAGMMCLQGACVNEGSDCMSDADCEEGFNCEPTTGSCLPEQNAEACRFRPPAGDFNPIVEWTWPTPGLEADVRHVLMTPVVGDLDADGLPEVVFTAYPEDGDGQIVVLNGEDGSKVAVSSTDDFSVRRSAHLAIGNIDEDPQLEIIASAFRDGIMAIDLEGSTLRRKWLADSGSLDSGLNGVAPSLADIDGDGSVEIIAGLVILSSTGQILADRGTGGTHEPDRFGSWGSLVADVNGDGQQDIVTGNGAYQYASDARDGLRQIWRRGDLSDGFLAIANMDDDSAPEIVVVSNGEVRVMDATDGEVEWGPMDLPGGGSGGAPTIADFDSDGRPEFAVAGEGRYTVFDMDCTGRGGDSDCEDDGIRWSRQTQDISSSITGSSVFDFEGDGSAEVVYNDECHLRVFGGRTGDVLLEAANTSRTSGEYPVIADIDGDGKAEIIVAANSDNVAEQCGDNATSGVMVLGDLKDFWVRTRAIWNQHSYHVTNVNDDGSIPRQEMPSWQLTIEEGVPYNGYRQNVQPSGHRLDAPDLKILAVTPTVESCRLRVAVTLANEGNLGVAPGVSIAVYLRNPAGEQQLFETIVTTRALLPSEQLVVMGAEQPVPQGYEDGFELRVNADDDGTGVGTRAECVEGNNSFQVPGLLCQ